MCIVVAIISAVLITLLSIFGKKMVKNVAKKYDEKTITPSDYCLYLELTL